MEKVCNYKCTAWTPHLRFYAGKGTSKVFTISYETTRNLYKRLFEIVKFVKYIYVILPKSKIE